MFSSFKVHDISCVCVGVEGNELFLIGRTVNYGSTTVQLKICIKVMLSL